MAYPVRRRVVLFRAFLSPYELTENVFFLTLTGEVQVTYSIGSLYQVRRKIEYERAVYKVVGIKK